MYWTQNYKTSCGTENEEQSAQDKDLIGTIGNNQTCDPRTPTTSGKVASSNKEFAKDRSSPRLSIKGRLKG